MLPRDSYTITVVSGALLATDLSSTGRDIFFVKSSEDRPLGRTVTNTLLLSSVHSSSSARASKSATFLSSFFAASQTHNFACPLPSRSERKARKRPSGDQVGDQLALFPLPPVTFLALPVLTSRM